MSTATPPAVSPPPETPAPDLKVLWTRLALFIAIIGVLGSLHLSITMNLEACALCYYQRAFIMSTAAVLLFAMFLPGVPSSAVAVLALAPAFAGAAVAGHHAAAVWNGVLECPMGITGVLAAPVESLIVFALLVGALLGDLLHQNKYFMQGVGALLLGYLLCNLCMRSVAPPKEPTAPYDPQEEIKTCRKVYHEKEKT